MAMPSKWLLDNGMTSETTKIQTMTRSLSQFTDMLKRTIVSDAGEDFSEFIGKYSMFFKRIAGDFSKAGDENLKHNLKLMIGSIRALVQSFDALDIPIGEDSKFDNFDRLIEGTVRLDESLRSMPKADIVKIQEIFNAIKDMSTIVGDDAISNIETNFKNLGEAMGQLKVDQTDANNLIQILKLLNAMGKDGKNLPATDKLEKLLGQFNELKKFFVQAEGIIQEEKAAAAEKEAAQQKDDGTSEQVAVLKSQLAEAAQALNKAMSEFKQKQRDEINKAAEEMVRAQADVAKNAGEEANRTAQEAQEINADLANRQVQAQAEVAKAAQEARNATVGMARESSGAIEDEIDYLELLNQMYKENSALMRSILRDEKLANRAGKVPSSSELREMIDKEKAKVLDEADLRDLDSQIEGESRLAEALKEELRYRVEMESIEAKRRDTQADMVDKNDEETIKRVNQLYATQMALRAQIIANEKRIDKNEDPQQIEEIVAFNESLKELLFTKEELLALDASVGNRAEATRMMQKELEYQNELKLIEEKRAELPKKNVIGLYEEEKKRLADIKQLLTAISKAGEDEDISALQEQVELLERQGTSLEDIQRLSEEMDSGAFSSWVTDIKTLTVEIDRLKKKIDMPQEGSPVADMSNEFLEISRRVQSFKRDNPTASVRAAKQELLNLLEILNSIRQRLAELPVDTKGLSALSGKVETMSKEMMGKGPRYLFTDERNKELENSKRQIVQYAQNLQRMVTRFSLNVLRNAFREATQFAKEFGDA